MNQLQFRPTKVVQFVACPQATRAKRQLLCNYGTDINILLLDWICKVYLQQWPDINALG